MTGQKSIFTEKTPDGGYDHELGEWAQTNVMWSRRKTEGDREKIQIEARN